MFLQQNGLNLVYHDYYPPFRIGLIFVTVHLRCVRDLYFCLLVFM